MEIQWDKYKEDRWEIDFSQHCPRHGLLTDEFGHCPICISEPISREEEMAKKSFNQKLREYENAALRHYLESLDKDPDPRGETEEEYLEYRSREQAKIDAWEEKRRGR